MTTKSKTLVIIDADSIIYTVGYMFRNKKAKGMVEMSTSKFITDVIKNSGATHYLGFYGSKEEGAADNFRFDVYDKYKANRPPTPDFVKKWRPTIHNVFKDKWGFTPVEGMEADDAVAISANTYKTDFDKIVIATFDKDLKQIPNSYFYNMKNHTIDFINEVEAMRNLGVQILAGDSSDNIPGLPGIGAGSKGKPGKAHKVLEDLTTVESIRFAVMRKYCSYEKELRTKEVLKINKEIKDQILVDGENSEYAGLSEAKLNRKIRIQTVSKVDAAMNTLIPGGWKSYFIQQRALIEMLINPNHYFSVPDCLENPMAAILGENLITVEKVDKTKMDSFLTI